MTLPLLDGVKLDGFPVEQLYPGWSPSSRDVVADDFSVVVFKEDATGKQACWWLEGDDYCASHVLTLDEAARKRLLVAMDRVFWPLATGVLGAPLPPQASPSCETLPEIAVNELSGSWIGGFAPHTLLLPSGHADSGEALSCPNGRQIAENRLTALLAAQRGQGPLIVSSPFTALPLLAQITFQVQSLSVSRFQDADTVFYLIWNEAFPALRPSFYYPDAPMLISDDPAAAMIPGLILGWYARHPEYVSLIRDARPFRAEDFGVGQASGFRSTPPEETPPPSPPKETPSYTLSQPPAPTSHLPASGQRLKSRIKSLFSRR